DARERCRNPLRCSVRVAARPRSFRLVTGGKRDIPRYKLDLESPGKCSLFVSTRCNTIAYSEGSLQIMNREVQQVIKRLRAYAACAGLLLFLFLAFPSSGLAQEYPYFVTYSHHMEEPGNLEIAVKSAAGNPPVGNSFVGASMEFEYGVKGW